MEFSLAQLLGLYFIIIGALALYRKKSIMPAMNQLVANRPLLLVLSLVELLAGLAVVIQYPGFSMDWMGLISVIGWMLIIESILYLATPYKKVQKIMKHFNKDKWYVSGGAIALVAGLYLAGVGFGFFTS